MKNLDFSISTERFAPDCPGCSRLNQECVRCRKKRESGTDNPFESAALVTPTGTEATKEDLTAFFDSLEFLR